MKQAILIVCMGNICRSPVAEGLLRHKLRIAGLVGSVRLDSAGTGAWHAGMPPDSRAIQVCHEHGIAIDDLRARQVVADDFDTFDLILCADRRNLDALKSRMAQGPVTAPCRATLGLLLEHAGLGAAAEVPDPYDGDIRHFREVFDLLDRATDGLLTRLQLPA